MENFGKFLTAAKQKIRLQFRIEETCFTSIDVIGGKICSNNPKNMNYVHKDSKDLVSVTINLGKNISGGGTVFNVGVKKKDSIKRYHVLKYLHGRIIMGPFERCFHEGSLWKWHRTVIYFIFKTFLCISFVMGISFINDI